MDNIAIDHYDKGRHAVVVGASLDGSDYRKPLLGFISEGDARLFVHAVKRHALGKFAMRQLEEWQKRFPTDRKRVTDFDYRIRDGEISRFTLKHERLYN